MLIDIELSTVNIIIGTDHAQLKHPILKNATGYMDKCSFVPVHGRLLCTCHVYDEFVDSFGAFLCRDFSLEKRLRLKEVQSLGELYNIVGESHFQESLKKFDEINEEVIALYYHKLELLKNELAGEAKIIVDNLAYLPELLYWRDKRAAKRSH